MPFRDAHEVIGKIVLHCEKNGLAIDSLTIEQLKGFSPLFDADVFGAISLETCVGARSLPGGPAPESVKAHIKAMKRILSEYA